MLESLHKRERRGVAEIPVQQSRPAADALVPDTRFFLASPSIYNNHPEEVNYAPPFDISFNCDAAGPGNGLQFRAPLIGRVSPAGWR
jgi:hypothetical protein